MKHLKHMFATSAFSAISPCCLGMEACRCVEFSGIELAAPVEQGAVGQVEKTAVGPCTLEGHGGEGGRRAAALWRGGYTGWWSGGAGERETRLRA